MPTLEHVAALAFREELLKIACESHANDNDLEKSAAIELFDSMSVENVEQFLKEAGLWDLTSGAAKGLWNVTRGAGVGAGRVAGGVLGGMKDLAVNSVGRAGAAIKAAPGALGQRMTNWGKGLEAGGARLGGRMSMGGAGIGESARARIGGVVKPPPPAAPPASDAYADKMQAFLNRPRPDLYFHGNPSNLGSAAQPAGQLPTPAPVHAAPPASGTFLKATPPDQQIVTQSPLQPQANSQPNFQWAPGGRQRLITGMSGRLNAA